MSEKDINKLLSTEDYAPIIKVLNKIPEWKAIKDAGEDPVFIVSKYIETARKFYKNDENCIAFLTGKLKNEIKILESKDNRGIIIGAFDRYNEESSTKRPVNVVMLTNECELKKIAVFKPLTINEPGVYTLEMTHQPENNSYIARSILDKAPITQNPLPILLDESMDGLRYTVESPEWEDGTIQITQYPPVIVQGTVSYIQPLPVFEEIDGKRKKVSDQPVYQYNNEMPAPRLHPTFNLVLAHGDTNRSITINFGRCHNCVPYFGVDDLDGVLGYAINNCEAVEEQIELLKPLFIGREFIFIGSVTQMRTVTDKEGYTTERISIRGASCMPVNESYGTCMNNMNSGVSKIETTVPKTKKVIEIEDNDVDDTTFVVDGIVVENESVVEEPKKAAVKVVSKKIVKPPLVEEEPVEVDTVDESEIVEDTIDDEESVGPTDDISDAGLSDEEITYESNPNKFISIQAKKLREVVRVLCKTKEEVTLSYAKKQLELNDLPTPVIKQIVNIVVSSM